jgi:hypothetical protein
VAFEKESQRFQENFLKPVSKADHRNVNPFRGLEFFDFKHARFFCGRKKRVAEALDVLEQKAAANKPFVLVLGPAGCGKTSLVRAGILPLLTQAGKVEENGPWRHALTRPATGGRNPFDALAAALLTKSGLPEFPGAAAVNAWENLAVDLREHPERAALLLRGTLDRLSVKASKSSADHQGFELAAAGGKEGVEFGQQDKLGRVKPRVRCTLVVDQLEELFAGGIPPEQKQRYLAALAALVRCQGFFVIATLRSDFYDSFLRTCGPDNLAVLRGRFELSPPTAHEIGEMIRLPSEAIGLRFEKDPKTGRNLDEAISEAASVNAEPLPLVEHLLSQLYQKQMPRGDGLLRWSDYHELGELKGALAHHAESAFLALDGDAQDALRSVIRQLVSPVHGQQGVWIRRTISYWDLVSAPELYDQKAGAKELVDRFIKEGLFYAEVGLNGERHVTVTQEALLRSWPRVRQLLSDDVGLLRMRDQLEADLKLWLSRGRRRGDLLRSELGLGEAETLVRGFRTSLTDAQVDYVQRSLKAQRRRRRFRRSLMLAAMVGLASLVIVPVVKWSLERQTAEMLAASQRDALQAQLKETEAKIQQAQQNAELAASQRDALQTRLKDTEASAQQAQKNAQQVASQRDALQAQLKETEAGSRQLQKDLEVATSQREGLQGQLKDSEAKLQQAQNNGELVASERDRLQAQLVGLSAAQQAQKSKGLGSAEATAVTGVNADAVSTDPTSKNEPMTQDQEPAKFARMNQSQATASPPIPSVAASVGPTPGAQADSSSKASAEERSLKEFVQEYIKTVASDDISTQERFFAQRVNFYGQGVLSLPGVQASMERYDREWPIRKWEASGEPEFPKTLHSTNPHLYEVLQPLTWTVSNGLEHKRGNGTLYVRISKDDKGEFHIVHVEQRNP